MSDNILPFTPRKPPKRKWLKPKRAQHKTYSEKTNDGNGNKAL